MSLLVSLRDKIMEEIIEPNRHQLSILILDERTKLIMSCCTKLHELADKGICSVERLESKRQVLSIHALYFISPTQKSLGHLIDDFDSNSTYTSARVFTTGVIPDDLMKLISQNNLRRYLKQLTEIYVDFIPQSTHIFSIDSPDAFHDNFAATQDSLPLSLQSDIESLASFFAFFRDLPEIAYYKPAIFTYKFAAVLKERIASLSTSESFGPSKSLLIILDRSFDVITPIIHSLRLSSLAYDTNKISRNVYMKSPESGIVLDDFNDFWVKFRHLHIAEALKGISQTMKNLTKESSIETTTVSAFADKVKQMPLYRKQLKKLSTLLEIAEDCLEYCKSGGQAACEVEQELVSGIDKNGETIKDLMVTILPIIIDKTVPIAVKLRIFFLYVIQKKGISRANVDRILGHAAIPSTDFKAVENLQKLGVKIFDGEKMTEHYYRKCHVDVSKDEVLVGTRWKPCLVSLVRETLAGKLNKNMFSLVDGGVPTLNTSKVVSARFGAWASKDSRKGENTARMIIYVIGGITQGEIAAVNDLNEELGNSCQIILGSDSISTWPTFLEKLRTL